MDAVSSKAANRDLIMWLFMATGLAVPRIGTHAQGSAGTEVERVAGHVHAGGTGVQREEVVHGVAAAISTRIADAKVQVEEGWGRIATVHGSGGVVQGAIGMEGDRLVGGVVALEGEARAERGAEARCHMVVIHVDLAVGATLAVNP